MMNDDQRREEEGKDDHVNPGVWKPRKTKKEEGSKRLMSVGVKWVNQY